MQRPDHRLVLVLGGTRSGKSAWAERLAAERDAPVRYVATAPNGPDGDGERIAAHRARRPADWETVDAGTRHDLHALLHDAGPDATVLIDGLGAWLAGVLHGAGLLDDDGRGDDPAHGIDGASVIASAEQAAGGLAAAAVARGGLTIVVGEEAGMAPVAADRGTRRWVDLLGSAHQALAARADRVVLVVAGRAVDLSDAGEAPHAATSKPSGAGERIAPDAAPDAAPDPPAAPVPPSEPTPAPSSAPAPPAADGPAWPALDDDGTPSPRRPHGDRMVPEGMLDFAVNVVDGDPPGWARQALQAGISDLTPYPDDRPAIAALAVRHGRDPEGVLPLGGAAEGFWRVALALRPRHAAVVVPGFIESEAALRAVGTRISHVPRTAKAQWALDPGAVPEECDLVVVGRPENPTGTLDPREAILRLRRPGRTVLVDEAFADFVADADALADHRDGDDGPGELLVLRSLTKTLSVPGVRCGYLVGSPDVIARVRDAGPPWSCSTPALELLRAYAERPDACDRIAARTVAHRADLTARLQQLAGVQVWPSQANFVLVRVPDGVDAVAGLHRHGIAVRPCGSFVGLDDRHIRVTVRVPALHARLTVALADVISSAEREG
ncbi:MAG: bifunctional adenosylcobinamide kinase/adenosylcobinamide-phosphate guanylyltransferase [Patulibacter sp.]|nr:bifunctional adenosylcobinamide kinase/adenosylcobinamide-phosphate guanylyltransferase [Patulibacter sp.]